ncbi:MULTISPECIES: ABC transporter ATP-binding protein [Shouchella]|uniref:ABC transporter, ATP-binding protein n=3 Tax=Bacillaceae TaxID=186817 RepID=A0A060LZ31_9BACI|nr:MULTISPECIES: ABC transporter ATP-binding protein [Bacillaceae]RQW22645.1 ABC transporter ATP-binding protein [Bacillus sp. C1-1]AIC93054.1 ABC transporter, ATP-binding protein [Shouchella lehensis G1]KQL58287.1 multidrug ABC transporter ATP-binding protein [Alkalicoccobacillus plakortidis]MBG9783165.1 multidrug ABC transporter ATP-binding protein [Shouchella lehensis]TES49469.1 ABC transporter ATP-binding protein [Shouchella lehensis]
MTVLLEMENISKTFKRKHVLKNVTLDVPAGSIVGFVGDNGAGKSTTFKTILGLIKKDEGTVRLFGEEVHGQQPSMREQVGVVFDAINLPAELTIKQLNKVFVKMYSSWDQEGFDRLLETFHLPTDKKVKEFSRGMSMKLSVAVALSHNAKLLLLDEATGGLDPSSRKELLEELTRFVEENKGGILLSSHIMSDIEKIADHLVFIKDGEIILTEKREVIQNQYAIVEMNENDLSTVEPEHIVTSYKEKDAFVVLISDKRVVPDNVPVNELTLEDLSVFLARGEKK